MTTRALPKTALAALAATALFLPFGAPLPGSCLRSVGIAGAAPSPSCGGDLRECLRAAADTHTTTFGGRYVTADDVALCMEAFRSCISGGASRGSGGAPPNSTAAGGASGAGFPQRFTVSYERSLDCQTTGGAVNCRGTHREQRGDGTYTENLEYSGSVSGMTTTGTMTVRSDATGFCVSHTDYSAAVSFTLSPDGAVTVNYGPGQMETVYSGGCADSPRASSTSPPVETTGTWSPTG